MRSARVGKQLDLMISRSFSNQNDCDSVFLRSFIPNESSGLLCGCAQPQAVV